MSVSNSAGDNDDYDDNNNSDIAVVNIVDYQADACTKQTQAECEDISDELYQKHMEWLEVFKRHSTPSHENQEERVVTYSSVTCISLFTCVLGVPQRCPHCWRPCRLWEPTPSHPRFLM